MTRDGIRQFLQTIADGSIELRDQGEWVSTHCPLARWRHAHGTDKNMSFGVHVSDVSESVYHCFTCKARGPLWSLLDRLSEFTGEDYRELRREVMEEELLGLNAPEWGSRKRRRRASKLGEPVSEDMLEVYEPAAGHPYLTKRGIDDTTAEYLGLCVDPDNKGEERILFPVFSPEKAFYGYTGRATRDGAEPRIRDYFGLPKRLLLLGAHLVKEISPKYVILVEGLFDYAKLATYEEPVVAAMHSGVTQAQAAMLRDIGLPLYAFLDNDAAGREGVALVANLLARHVPVHAVNYPRGAKDPAMLNYAEVRKMLREAVLM